jgi:phenylalanyl-tRNA synthetase beta chain
MDVSDLSIEEIAEKLTRAGFEVEGIEPLSQGTNLVIGQVLTCEPHPDSDHLHVTTVDVKDEVLNIVCGAPNVAAGQKVIVAKAGAKLPGGEIKRGNIRGQESNGMICALFELGVDRHMLSQAQLDGIEILPEDAPIGYNDPLGYLGYNDEVLEIGLTPNRSDCLAAFNMALETGAVLDREVKLPAYEGASNLGKESDLIIESETEGCPQFLGKVIGSVTIKESPKWMKELLRASGVHSINNVVDISNIVMLETGQPMHFYDLSAIKGKEITVKDGFSEPYTALDGITYDLLPEDVVITNQGKPIGIAGIMGGDDSKILDTTTGLIIECAQFNHVRIRNTARRLNLNTEASVRYQKGIEPLAAQKAMDRAVQLLIEYADAKEIEETVEYGHNGYEPKTLTCTLSQLNARLGTDFGKEEVFDVFKRLNFDPVLEGETYTVSIPSYRTDMEGMADLSEEIIRILGYDRLPSTLPKMEMTEGKLNPQQKQRRTVGEMMRAAGLSDAVTYTLISTNKKDNAILSAGDAIELSIPMSEERRWIRTSVLPSLLDVVAYNNARGIKDVNLYEISDVSAVQGSKEHLAFVLSGSLQASRWNHYELPADFYTAKGLIESLLEKLGINPARISFKENKKDTVHFHPYRSAEIYIGKDLLGYVGQIHPKYAAELGLKEVIGAELDLSKLLAMKKSKIKFAPVSKFPAVSRDLAMSVDRSIPAKSLEEVIERSGKCGKENIIQSVDVFDVYEGVHVKPTEKSMAFNVVFQSKDHTLTEQEISQTMAQIIAELEKRFNATLRK